MPDFDINQWYHISSALLGTNEFLAVGESIAAVYFKLPSGNSGQWQLFPFNETYYILRDAAAGPAMGMNTYPGGNTPRMATIAEDDESKFWTIEPWDDGTFFMTNGPSGNEWHLEVNSHHGMIMSSNITGQQDGQRYTFSAISAIDDSNFSTISMNSGTSSATLTSSATSTHAVPTISSGSTVTSTSSLSPVSSQSSRTPHPSPAISGIIGGSIVAFLVLIAAIIFGLLQRRKRKSTDLFKGFPKEETKALQPFPVENQTLELYVQPAEVPGGYPDAWEMG